MTYGYGSMADYFLKDINELIKDEKNKIDYSEMFEIMRSSFTTEGDSFGKFVDEISKVDSSIEAKEILNIIFGYHKIQQFIKFNSLF